MSNPSILQTSCTSPIYITELLALVFSQLDDRSLARAAQVHRQWADVALDTLWHSISDMRALLGLLAPYTSERKQSVHGTVLHIKFRRPLTRADWQRFDRYSWRVRALNIDELRPTPRQRYVDPAVYAEIERTCPRREVLPNLQSLHWYTLDAGRQSRSVVFMHPNILELGVQLHPTIDPSLQAYLAALVGRAPRATKLELRSRHPVQRVQNEVISLLSQLSHLHNVVVPMYYLTSEVMTQLSRAERLEAVEIAQPIEHGIGARDDVAVFLPQLHDHAFPLLRHLAFSAHLQHATQFLAGPHAPRGIEFLHIFILAIDNPPELHRLFTVVAAHYGQLKEFRVDFMLAPGTPVASPPPPPVARPSLATLEPLFSCAWLTKFDLRWDYQLNLTEANVDAFARAWPALEVLNLNSEPVPELGLPTLGAGVLRSFAAYCPHLRELAVYIDGNRVPPPADGSTVTAVQPFRSLRKLALGSSPLTHVEPMALFLSRLCSLDCEIGAGVRWPDAYGIALDNAGITDERRARMSEWWLRWTDVGKVLPLAIKARMEEQAQAAELRRDDRGRIAQLESEMRQLKLHFGLQ